MSSFGTMQIHNKKVVGKKLLYLCVTDTMKKWIDYEQLTDYLPQVIEYEKRQSHYFSDKRDQKTAKQKFVQEKIHDSSPANFDQFSKSSIKYLEFVDIVGYDHSAKEKIILFKAFLTNGKTQFMTNTEIKTLDMNSLVRFYQSQIKYHK